MARKVTTLFLGFYKVATGDGGYVDTVHELIRILKLANATILSIARKTLLDNFDEVIDEEEDEGIFSGLSLWHEKLLPEDTVTPFAPPGGTAGLSYLHPEAEVSFNQDTTLFTAEQRDRVALAFVDFASHIFPALRPALGYLDSDGENHPSQRNTSRRELPYLFWANFFGPPYVERYGRDFLLAAPAWKTVELPEGGVLLITHESFSEWIAKRSPELIDYLSPQAPNIRPYRAKRINID